MISVRFPSEYLHLVVIGHLQNDMLFWLINIWFLFYVFRIVPFTVREISLVFSFHSVLHPKSVSVLWNLSWAAHCWLSVLLGCNRPWEPVIRSAVFMASNHTFKIHSCISLPVHSAPLVILFADACLMWLNFYKVCDSFVHIFIEYLLYVNH